MKTNKAKTFWAAFLALVGIYILTLFVEPRVLDTIGGMIIGGIVVAGGFYQGTNVADNALKGKFYRSELDRGEK